MMDPFLPLLVFLIAMVGIQMKSMATVLAALAICFISVRDFFPYFLLGVILSAALWYLGFVDSTESWAAISLAIILALVAIAGRERKKEEEIPPEMIPYLLAMMEGGRK